MDRHLISFKGGVLTRRIMNSLQFTDASIGHLVPMSFHDAFQGGCMAFRFSGDWLLRQTAVSELLGLAVRSVYVPTHSSAIGLADAAEYATVSIARN
ncbi:MAG TPA: hypothetical protein VJ654_19655 [Noviherbaspirillum sp.]|nr:hypothetical protein [Noviherbaspirillum sp.]